MRSQSDEFFAPLDLAAVRKFVADWRSQADEDDLLDSLDQRQQADLMAVAWLGSGLYSLSEWAEARFEAWAALGASTPGHLRDLPGLADFLEAGLARFRPTSPLH